MFVNIYYFTITLSANAVNEEKNKIRNVYHMENSHTGRHKDTLKLKKYKTRYIF